MIVMLSRQSLLAVFTALALATLAGCGTAGGTASGTTSDGRLDVVISTLNRAPVLLKNAGGAGDGNWLTIQARGRKSNTFGLGATVKIETSEGAQVREISNVASYLSSNDIRLHVGLGRAKTVRRLEIVWPSGMSQVLENVPVNQILVIEESS